MTAYVVLDIKITDPSGYEDYKKLSPAALAAYGGKYLARGGVNETLEGDWHANRLVIIEFDSMERAKQWLNSPEYAPAKALRHRYAQSQMVVVEGL